MNKKLLGKICICAAAAAAAYLVFENEALTLTKYEFSSTRLPKEFDGFKIVHLSDVHGKSFGRDNSRLLALVSGENPDIIVISGDLIDGRRIGKETETALDLAERLASVAPTYFVTGNHEEKLPDALYREIMTRLGGLGVTLLDGRAKKIERGGSALNLCGVFDSGYFDKNAAEALVSPEAFNILLCHRPQFAAEFASAGFDLAFSGHAHGGQARLPFVGGLIAPDQLFFPDYYEGVYRFGGRATIVSRGIGNSLIPFRVNNRPEVVSVTLERK